MIPVVNCIYSFVYRFAFDRFSLSVMLLHTLHPAGRT
ncbi:hypothetical protein ABIE50_001196 [Chitinophaga sp. OAE865]